MLYDLLSFERVTENMASFCQALNKTTDVTDIETLKIDCLNLSYEIPNIPIRFTSPEVTLHFEMDEDFEHYLDLYEPASAKEKMRNEFSEGVWGETERKLFTKLIDKALTDLAEVDQNLFKSFYCFLSKIYILPCKSLVSGSSFRCWGMIIISPKDPDHYYEEIFEAIVHEALHQILYIESVIHPLHYPETKTYLDEADIKFKGAITLSSRGLETAIHACIIANILMRLYCVMGKSDIAMKRMENYNIALEHLKSTAQDFDQKGKSIITTHTYKWLEAIEQTDWQKLQQTGTASIWAA